MWVSCLHRPSRVNALNTAIHVNLLLKVSIHGTRGCPSGLKPNMARKKKHSDPMDGGGRWDFRFCGFGHFLDQFFGFAPKNCGFLVLASFAVCGFSF